MKLPLLSCSLLLAPVSATAQTVVNTFSDPALTQVFGATVASLGDLDGDGVPDFAIADPTVVHWLPSEPSGVNVYSGATRSLLYTLRATQPSTKYGDSISPIDDVNGDTVPDLVIGVSIIGFNNPNGTPSAELISGVDGSLIFSVAHPDPSDRITFGYEVLGMDDINGDRVPDFLVSAPASSTTAGENAGRIYAFSGANGATLWSMDGQQAYGGLGFGLALMSDLNGDGIREFAAGRPSDTSPQVQVVNSTNGQVLRVIKGEASWTWFGGSLASVGDVTGDGYVDVLVGSPLEGGRIGGARLYTGEPNPPSNVALFTKNGPYQGANLGESVSAAGDVNGDGVPDFLVGADHKTNPIPGTPGNVEVFSGADFSLIAHIDGPVGSGARRFGAATIGIGDTTGDGQAEILVGEIGEGVAHLITVDLPVIGQVHCTSTNNSTGSTASMAATGSDHLAHNSVLLRAWSLPANKPGLFFYGAAAAQVPFGNGVRCVDAGGVGLFRLPVHVSSSTGAMQHNLDLNAPPQPSGQILAGSTWYFQCWFRDPAAGAAQFDLSDGVSVTFLP